MKLTIELDEEDARHLAWLLQGTRGADVARIRAALEKALVEPRPLLGVHPYPGGPKSLRCFDCGEWVTNTANAEMMKEGFIGHSHVCKPLAEREEQPMTNRGRATKNA